MKRKIYMRFVFILAFFMVDNAFSAIKSEEVMFFYKTKKAEIDLQSNILNSQERIIPVVKTTKDNLTIYTFKPDSRLDDYTIEAMGNRHKAIVEGFVSFTVNDKDEVILVTETEKTNTQGVLHLLKATTKLYGYYNYKIEE